MDRDLPGGVLGHTLVHILISGCPQRLDPQHGPRTLVKLDCLPWATGREEGEAAVRGVGLLGEEQGAVLCTWRAVLCKCTAHRNRVPSVQV